jgi:hypothetical protein
MHMWRQPPSAVWASNARFGFAGSATEADFAGRESFYYIVGPLLDPASLCTNVEAALEPWWSFAHHVKGSLQGNAGGTERALVE